MANREEGAAVPNWRQRQEQLQPQDAVRQRHIHLNWLNFKPEFLWKPEEDAKAHLLHSNDWMNAHCFEKDIKEQRFASHCWGKQDYGINLKTFGRHYMVTKYTIYLVRHIQIRNTCEKLFHTWRSFTFDENTETIYSYVIRIIQVANLLGYWELQILEVFKNTLPTNLYWILFPIEDLRQAVDTAKRILTKEKLDKQLTGQTSTSPFMSIREGTDKRVSFNTKDELGDKIDKLTVVMSKLVAKDSHERRTFKPQIYKSRGQNRSNGKGQYWARSNDRNKGYCVNSNTRQDYWGNRFRGSLRGNSRQNSREEYRSERYGNNNRNRDRSRGRTFTGIIGEIVALAMTGLDQSPELVQIGIE